MGEDVGEPMRKKDPNIIEWMLAAMMLVAVFLWIFHAH
jgi:hypothetical protein